MRPFYAASISFVLLAASACGQVPVGQDPFGQVSAGEVDATSADRLAEFVLGLPTSAPAVQKKSVALQSAKVFEAAYARANGKEPLNQWPIRHVVSALIVADEIAEAERIMPMIETWAKVGNYSGPPAFALEARALVDLMAKQPSLLPGAVAWPRKEPASTATTIQWEFVICLTSRLRGDAMIGVRRTVIGDVSEDKATRTEQRSPLLSRLSGRYDVEIQAGETQKDLRTVATIKNAPWKGEMTVSALPTEGFMRAVVRSATLNTESPAHAYSLSSPLFSTGTMPEAAANDHAVGCKLPVNDALAKRLRWPPGEIAYRGRPVTELLPIDQTADYLLTVWPAWDSTFAFRNGGVEVRWVNLVFLDADLHEVGMQSVAEFAMNTTSHPWRLPRFTDMRMAPDQMFLPTCGVGNPPLPKPIRYAVFTVRGVDSLPLPLLQFQKMEFRDPSVRFRR